MPILFLFIPSDYNVRRLRLLTCRFDEAVGLICAVVDDVVIPDVTPAFGFVGSAEGFCIALSGSTVMDDDVFGIVQLRFLLPYIFPILILSGFSGNKKSRIRT